ncbi:chemotaxis protein CheW [Caulobacter segnis]
MELASPGQLELISFEIGGQEFCIDISVVREIRGWTPATPCRRRPTHIRGVINLRGAVMPVLGPAQPPAGLGSTELSSRHVIVVVQFETRMVGLPGGRRGGDLHGRCGAAPSAAADGYDRRTLRRRHRVPLEGRMLSRLGCRLLHAGRGGDGRVTTS